MGACVRRFSPLGWVRLIFEGLESWLQTLAPEYWAWVGDDNWNRYCWSAGGRTDDAKRFWRVVSRWPQGDSHFLLAHPALSQQPLVDGTFDPEKVWGSWSCVWPEMVNSCYNSGPEAFPRLSGSHVRSMSEAPFDLARCVSSVEYVWHMMLSVFFDICCPGYSEYPTSLQRGLAYHCMPTQPCQVRKWFINLL